MNRGEVIEALEAVRDAHVAWRKAKKEYELRLTSTMKRLVHEAARATVSVDEMALYSGLSKTRIRAMMRQAGINPHRGKALLSRQSAEVLRTNAGVMGVDPSEINLNTLLAYLPAGSLFLETVSVSEVTEIPEGESE